MEVRRIFNGLTSQAEQLKLEDMTIRFGEQAAVEQGEMPEAFADCPIHPLTEEDVIAMDKARWKRMREGSKPRGD